MCISKKAWIIGSILGASYLSSPKPYIIEIVCFAKKDCLTSITLLYLDGQQTELGVFISDTELLSVAVILCHLEMFSQDFFF